MPTDPFSQNLELREDNPYTTGNIFLLPEGDFQLDRKPISLVKSIRDRYHTVVEDETLSKLAFDYYGNSKYWWIISDVNDLAWPFTLEPGSTLWIPDINKTKLYI